MPELTVYLHCCAGCARLFTMPHEYPRPWCCTKCAAKCEDTPGRLCSCRHNSTR